MGSTNVWCLSFWGPVFRMFLKRPSMMEDFRGHLQNLLHNRPLLVSQTFTNTKLDTEVRPVSIHPGDILLNIADLHTRNLAFVIPFLHTLTEADLLQKLRSPEIRAVIRKDGKPLEPGLPAYLAWPASYPNDVSLPKLHIKIIDFGESFCNNDILETVRTPLCVRAPEVIFGEKLDYRVDLWSAGCMVSLDPGRIGESQVANN